MAQDGNNILGEVLQAIGGGLAAAAGPEIFQPFIESVSKERERRVAEAKRTRNNRIVLEARMADPEWAAAFTEASGMDSPESAVSSMEGLSESELRLVMSGVGDELLKRDQLDSAYNQIARDYADEGYPVPPRPEGQLTRGYLNGLREGYARLAGSKAMSAQKRSAVINKYSTIVDAHAQDPLGSAAGSVIALDSVNKDGLSPEDLSLVQAEEAKAKRRMNEASISQEATVDQAAFNKGDYTAYASDPQTRFSKSRPDMGPTIERLSPTYEWGLRMAQTGLLGAEGDEGVVASAVAQYGSLEQALNGMKPEDGAKLLHALHQSQGAFPYKSEKREAFRQQDDFRQMLEAEGIGMSGSLGSIQEVGGKLTFVPNTNAVIDEVYETTGNRLVSENDRRAWSEQSSLPDSVKAAVINKSRQVARAAQTQNIVETTVPNLGLEYDNTEAATQFAGLIDPGGGKVAVIEDLGGAFKPMTRSTVIGATRVGATYSTVSTPGFEGLGWKEAPTTPEQRRVFLPFVDSLSSNDVNKLNANAKSVVRAVRNWDEDQRAAFIKGGTPVASAETFRSAALDVVLPRPQGALADSYIKAAAMEENRLALGLGDLTEEATVRGNIAKYTALSEAYSANAAVGSDGAAAAVTVFADMVTDVLDLEDGEEIGARIQSFLEKEQDLFGGGGANVTDIVTRVGEAETIRAKFSAFEDYLTTHKAIFVANDPAQSARRQVSAEIQLQSVRNIRALAAAILDEGELGAANAGAAGFGPIDIPQSQWAKYDSPEDRAYLIAFTLLSSPKR